MTPINILLQLKLSFERKEKPISLYILPFAKIIILSDSIAEVIINDKIEMTLAMVEQYHEFLLAHLVSPFSLLINKVNNYNRSYKVTIQSSDKNKVCSPEAWESNIIIKPFRKRQSRFNQNNRKDGNYIPSFQKYQYDQDDLRNNLWV